LKLTDILLADARVILGKPCFQALLPKGCFSKNNLLSYRTIYAAFAVSPMASAYFRYVSTEATTTLASIASNSIPKDAVNNLNEAG